MEKNFFNIFKTFFKIGTLLLGGGYVILPLLQSELADKKCWATTDELCEYYALSQSLPGVIAANVSIFVGYKLLGIRGAVSALSGLIMPAFLAIILISNILAEIVNFPTTKHIFAGVGVGVTVLVILTVKEMWGKSIVDKFSLFIFLYAMILALSHVSPVLIVLSCTFMGVIYRMNFPAKKFSSLNIACPPCKENEGDDK